MILRWSEVASLDLAAIYDYIALDSPESAVKVATRIMETTERLLDHPRLGKPGRRKDLRELVHPPYVVFYRIIGEVISIESVLHSSRRQHVN